MSEKNIIIDEKVTMRSFKNRFENNPKLRNT